MGYATGHDVSISGNLGPIGVFDSGFGGLSVLRGLTQELPQYDYVYLGDTARTPYGTRGSDVIYEFTEQAIDFLFKKGCPIIILACNTSSSEALRKLQQEYLPRHFPGRKILGVIIPSAEEAACLTANNNIGVIATTRTIASGVFERELKKLDFGIEVYQQACPLLVSLVEAGEDDPIVTQLILANYLEPLLDQHVDTLILGCTHYEFLMKEIRNIVGGDLHIVTQGKVLAKSFKNYLKRHSELERKLRKKSELSFFSTDLSDKFAVLGSKFFGKTIVPEHVRLD